MNIIEHEMYDLLKSLKEEYGVFEIKAEYENEGSRQTELMRLKDLTAKLDLPIIIKIGGVEAVTDIYMALTLGVKDFLKIAFERIGLNYQKYLVIDKKYIGCF